MAIHNERPEEHYPQTVVVKKTVEDQKAVASDLLGVSKNLGQGQVPRGDDFVHGVKNLQGEGSWNAARCIHGEPTDIELAPDNDLGRSTKPNCRNMVRKEEDMHRSFGVPTIRKDIPFKDFRSVADFQVSIFLTHKLILFLFTRTTVMNLKLLTCCSHRTTQRLAFKNKISANSELVKKLKLCSKPSVSPTKLVNSTLCITKLKKLAKHLMIELVSETSKWLFR
jgi:hypothetical protein